jgi:hypothetical protein
MDNQGRDEFDDLLLELILSGLLSPSGPPMIVIEIGNPFSRPPHIHECEPCQYEWSYDTRGLNREDYENAHRCPKCGAEVRKVKQYL